MGQYSFGKAERLKKEKIVQTLFEKGKAVSWNGFTLVYLEAVLPTAAQAQIGFSVPKKNFKNATDRNKIKRRMREAYRHNKNNLYQTLRTADKQLAMMLIYKGKAIPEYGVVCDTVTELQKKLAEKISR